MPSDDQHIHDSTVPAIAIILAGGASTRMGGTDKTRLQIAGATTLERVLRAAPAAERIVVGPDGQDGAELAAHQGARFVLEDPPRSGPLAALARGVQEIEQHAGSEHAKDRKVLVLGGDMPLLRRESLTRLLHADRSGTEVAALTDEEDQLQFLCAVWPLRRLRRALDAVKSSEGGWAHLSLRRLYSQLDDDELITFASTGSESTDVDTPADLAEARSAAGPRVALAQVIVHDDVAANFDTVRSAVARAADAGSDLVVFPEATLAPFGSDLRRAAEEHHGAFDELLGELARTHDLAIVAGSFTPADDGRVHNTVIVRGRSLHVDYHKIHLFDAYGARESETVAPGRELVTFDLGGSRLGLATCYDIRFPEQFTALARRGADTVVVPVAWAAGPGKSEQLRLLLRARALDSTMVVLAADQTPPAGFTGRGPRGIGESAAIGPLGQVREELGSDEGILVVDLDLAEVEAARLALPVLHHRSAAVQDQQ